LEEQRRGGESIQRFCRRRGLSAASFHYWKRRLGGSGGAVFVEARLSSVAERPVARRLVLRLTTGEEVAIEPGFDAATLREIVAALTEWPC
jgi:transposase-like protein